MDKATKLKICEMRLDGKNIYDVAAELKFTPQAIWNFLRTVPAAESGLCELDIDRETVLSLCERFIDGQSLNEISLMTGYSQPEIRLIFRLIAARKPIPIDRSIYPNLTDWMRLKGHTLASFAAILGITAPTFSNIVAGKKPMPYALALKIREYSKIPLNKIFEGYIVVDPEKLSKPKTPKKKGKDLTAGEEAQG